MQRSQRVTLADIAARSGVSTATASMILSERPDVSFSRETILRVREAAEALGYRAIRRHRPSHFMAGKSVAILCPNVVTTVISHSFRRSSSPDRTRYAGLRLGFGNNPEAAASIVLGCSEKKDMTAGHVFFLALPTCGGMS